MTTNHQILLEVLQNHRGKESAIKRRELLTQLIIKGAEFSMNDKDREMRIWKEELIIYGHPIGSCEKGYYICTTFEEAEEARAYQDKKAKPILFMGKKIVDNFLTQNNRPGIQLSLDGI